MLIIQTSRGNTTQVHTVSSDEVNAQNIYTHFWGTDRFESVNVDGKDHAIVAIGSFGRVLGLNLGRAQVLLVREEYKEAYNTLKESSYQKELFSNGICPFLVTGQPGIGAFNSHRHLPGSPKASTYQLID